jgi:multidrug resistance efflux pump
VKRTAKLAAGLLLAAGGAYVIVGEQMAGISADAVINAQVVTVRAPVDGELTLQVRNLGARLGQGEAIGRLEDPRPDATRLVDLRRSLAMAEADLGRLLDLTRALVASRAVLEGQADDYARGRVRQLESAWPSARRAGRARSPACAKRTRPCAAPTTSAAAACRPWPTSTAPAPASRWARRRWRRRATASAT